MSLLATVDAPHAPAHLAIAELIPQPLFLAVIAALLVWIVVYLLYKLVMTKRKDFGMPVRRRILCRKLHVDHDQSAEVPFWWTDLQVQYAVRSHWKQTLRAPWTATASEPASHL